MFKTRTIVMFAFALLMGLAAALLARNWANNRFASPEEAGVQVVVAAVQIPFGKKLESTDLRLVTMPAKLVPDSAHTTLEQLDSTVAMSTIYPDEIIMKEKVGAFGGGSTLSAVIAPSKRAVTVRVNDVIGVAGFLMPGNRVDVVAAKSRDGRTFQSQTLLEDIKVLAVDQTAAPEKDKPIIVRAVTLELTSEEAEKLVQATQEGTVQLALRNPLDDSKKQQQVTVQEPLAKKPVSKATNRSKPITVIRGTKVSTSQIKM